MGRDYLTAPYSRAEVLFILGFVARFIARFVKGFVLAYMQQPSIQTRKMARFASHSAYSYRDHHA